MSRATPASHIVIAASIAIIAGLFAGLLSQFSDTRLISLVALFSFISGLLTPWISQFLPAPGQSKPRAARSPRHSKPVATGTNQDGSDQVTLYIGNLPFKTDEKAVESTFADYGEVFAVRLVKDRRSGKRKGYGFVEMEPVGAELAQAKLNDTEFEGRTLKVRFANSEPKED